MDNPTPPVFGSRTRRSGVLRTTRETAFGALKSILAVILVATGIATLLALGPIPLVLADAGVPDLVGQIVAILMVANGALILIPRYTFVATVVPMTLAYFWFATGLLGGHLVAASLAIVVVFGLARVAYTTRPAALTPVA